MRTGRRGVHAARRLFDWRKGTGFGVAEGAALALFFSIAAYVLGYHEKWDDEAQAWLIARDNSFWQIVVHRLHYEGAPPLWPLLMHLFHVLGGTYVGLGWMSVAVATAGVYVWLRWSPFPTLLRFLFPFTFWLIYQYAVIARSYVLFPLLTFSLCALYTRKDKVVWFAVVAGLLANVSLQGFVVACSFAVLYAYDAWMTRRAEFEEEDTRGRTAWRKLHWRAGLVFGGMICVAVYCAIPAPDLDFGIGDQVSDGWVHRVLIDLVGETPRNAPRPGPEPPIVVDPDVLPPPPPVPHWNTTPGRWLEQLVYPSRPPVNHYALRWIFRTVGPVVLEFADDATWPLAESNVLACAFLVVLVMWLYRRRSLRMLLLWLVLVVSGKIWIAEHHAGMLVIALVAVTWLGANSGVRRTEWPRLERGFLTLFTAILVLQVGWSLYCLRSDVRGSYDPGPETARWLKAHPAARMAAFGFPTVSIEPWFARPPFINVPTSWWQWSSNVEVDGIHRTIIATRPDVVVYGVEFPGTGQLRDQWVPVNYFSYEEERNLWHDPIVNDLRGHGYVETHRFCGTRFSRFSSSYRICHLVFQPEAE